MSARPSPSGRPWIEAPAIGARGANARMLYDGYRAEVYAYCLGRLGDREEAADVVQETFLNAWLALGRGVVPAMPYPWLLTIARNLCVSRHRARACRIQAVRLDEETDQVPAREESGEALIELTPALRALPERQRRAFLLHEIRGLSYGEVAEELGLSYAAVATLLFRARRALAKDLGETAPFERPRRSLGLGSLLGFVKPVLGGGAPVKIAAALGIAPLMLIPSSGPEASRSRGFAGPTPGPPVVGRAHQEPVVTVSSSPVSSSSSAATATPPHGLSGPAAARIRMPGRAALRLGPAPAPAAAPSPALAPPLDGSHPPPGPVSIHVPGSSGVRPGHPGAESSAAGEPAPPIGHPHGAAGGPGPRAVVPTPAGPHDDGPSTAPESHTSGPPADPGSQGNGPPADPGSKAEGPPADPVSQGNGPPADPGSRAEGPPADPGSQGGGPPADTGSVETGPAVASGSQEAVPPADPGSQGQGGAEPADRGAGPARPADPGPAAGVPPQRH